METDKKPPFVTYPDRIFTFGIEPDRLEAESAERLQYCVTVAKVLRQLKRNAPPRADDTEGQADQLYQLQHLREFPQICAYLGPVVETDPRFKIGMTDNALGYYYALTYADNYDAMSHAFERDLVRAGNGQHICALLRWAAEHKKTLRFPRSFYYEALMQDPHWGMVGYHVGLVDDPHFLAKLREWVKGHYTEDSGAAYVWALAHPETAVTPGSALARVITLNPFYSYMAMSRLPLLRGFDLRELDATRVPPRWAYHLLMLGLRVNDSQLVKKSLYTHPGWLWQFMIDSKLVETNPRKAAAMHEEAIDVFHPHPLTIACGNAGNRYADWLKKKNKPKGAAA